MKRDYKRYFKNVILIFLISMSFVLVFRLWSVGNYFGTGLLDTFDNVIGVVKDPVIKLFKGFSRDESTQNLKFVLSPKRIVVNDSNKRSIMRDYDNDFLSFYEEVIKILRDTESDKIKIINTETVSADEYYSSLKGKSVLVDFDSKYDYNLFSVVTGTSRNSKLMGESAVVREFIISMPDNVLNYTALYIMDYNDNKVYKFTLDVDKTVLEELIQKRLLSNASPDTYFYSFELNFHKSENTDGTTAKVVFNPLTSVALIPEEREGIVSQTYGADGEELINEKELLKLFNINVMSAGKYKDIDGSKNFIEKNATLTIGTDGFIEYQTTEGGKGIKISDNNVFDIGMAITVTSDFVTEVLGLLPQSENDFLRITGDLTESDSSGAYTICYDYYIGGIPIFQTDKTTNGITNAVIAKVENGYLTYYKHYIRTYDYAGEKKVQETMITAADALVSKMMDNGAQVKVSKAYECFIDSGGGEPEADWVFEIEGLGGLYR